MKKWYTSWSLYPIDFRFQPSVVPAETQRIRIKNNIAGEKIRLKFSNRYSDHTLCFKHVSLAVNHVSELKSVTLENQRRIKLLPGEESWSDEIFLQVQAGDTLIIQTVTDKEQPVTNVCTTYGRLVMNVKNSSSGDFSAEKDFEGRAQKEYFAPVKYFNENQLVYGLSGVEVYSASKVRVVGCFGDSITHQGYWIDFVNEQLLEHRAENQVLINLGISGNRILNDTTTKLDNFELFGTAGIRRFEKDIQHLQGISEMIFLEGINDIYHPVSCAFSREEVSAEQMIEGLKLYQKISRSYCLSSSIGTILPVLGAKWCTPELEEKRRTVNAWIRQQKMFDRIIDLERAVAISETQLQLRQECDSGDFVHPNYEGGKVLGAAVNRALKLF